MLFHHNFHKNLKVTIEKCQSDDLPCSEIYTNVGDSEIYTNVGDSEIYRGNPGLGTF
jgi:hypothetical protein